MACGAGVAAAGVPKLKPLLPLLVEPPQLPPGVVMAKPPQPDDAAGAGVALTDTDADVLVSSLLATGLSGDAEEGTGDDDDDDDDDEEVELAF